MTPAAAASSPHAMPPNGGGPKDAPSGSCCPIRSAWIGMMSCGRMPMPQLDGIGKVQRAAKDAAEAGLRFKLVPFDRITLETTRAYIVKGIIPREGLVVVWGPPKCGKSFWVFDLVMHAALDWPYRGRRVQAGPIVYVA